MLFITLKIMPATHGPSFVIKYVPWFSPQVVELQVLFNMFEVLLGGLKRVPYVFKYILL